MQQAALIVAVVLTLPAAVLGLMWLKQRKRQPPTETKFSRSVPERRDNTSR
jgi:hypothetical protein